MIEFGSKKAKAFRFGNKDAKKIEVKKNGAWKTVWTPEPEYDYGDGHLNTVKGGYNDLLYVYSAMLGEGQKWVNVAESYWGGNLNNNSSYDKPPYFVTEHPYQKIQHVQGKNTCEVNLNASDDDIFFLMGMNNAGSASSAYVKDFSITVNNVIYTLNQAVLSGVIKPIVLITSTAQASTSAYSNHFFPNAYNLYNGGQTGSGVRAAFQVYFMLAKGNILNSFSFWSSIAAPEGSQWDGYGYQYCRANTCRLVLTLPQ